MFDIPPLPFSSTLFKLDLKVQTLADCLYLLDGRFNRLHTFYIELLHSHPPEEDIQNNVSSFIPESLFSVKQENKVSFFVSSGRITKSKVFLFVVYFVQME